MVRCRATSQDMPITFREREAGESKLTMKQNFQYLEQLAYLYWDRYPWLVILFFLLAFYVLYVLMTLVGLM